MTQRSILSAGIVSALLLLLATPPADAQATYRKAGRGHWGEQQSLRLLIGQFTPRGDSRYWDEKAIDFTGDADDFEDGAVELEYMRFLGPRLGLLVSLGLFEGDATQTYRNFVDDRGFDISHRTTLEIDSLTVGLVFNLLPRDKVVVPYVGAGAGFYSYRLEESGDFIEFGTFESPIFRGTFEAEGDTFGWYYLAGLEVPVTRNFAILGEARWQRAEDELGDDFTGFGDLDLSGRSYSLGLSWSF